MNARPVWRRCGLLAVSMSSLLNGCALIHHDGAPHAPVAPEQIEVANDIHLPPGGWPAARWWTRYGDAQLDAFIEQALAAAPTMVIARTRVAQAKSDVELVRTGSNLQVVALALLNQQHVSAHGFLGPFAQDVPAEGLTGPWYTEGIVGLGASLNIDIWGKQRAQIAASVGVSNARLAEMSAVELEISTDVAQLYYGIQTNYQLIELLNESRAVAAFAVHAQNQVRQLRESLRALAGATPDGLRDIEPVALPPAQAALPATLSYELLARRPDLQAMRWYVQSSFDRIDAAKAAFYPSFDIKAFFGFDALHLRDLFMHSSQQINLIPGLYLPIFDGGRLNANLSGAREGSNLLIEQYNQAVLNAVRDVAQTGSRLQALDSEAALQQRRIASVAYVRDSVEAHYRRGLTSQLAAFEARQPVIAEQVALLTLSGQMLSQEIALTKALGGGYRADPPVELQPR